MSAMAGSRVFDAARVIAELRELDARSGGRRVAWTEPWEQERVWLSRELERLPSVVVERDDAGNLWSHLAGDLDETIVVGSHLDSVPGGGWLDGALGVLAGLQLMREAAQAPKRLRSLAVVDWADEEGVRFGRSLFGSSAAAGFVSLDEVSGLRDADGLGLAETLRRHGLELDRAVIASHRLSRASAYLELHIEQGPVLEQEGRRCAAVAGALGIRRRRLRIVGASIHAGAPMTIRHDAGVVGAAAVVAARKAAQVRGGPATVGSLQLRPGIATAVPETCELVVDVRHERADALSDFDRDVVDAVKAAARQEGCGIRSELLLACDPVVFDRELVRRIAAVADPGLPVVSGALHDAVPVAQAGIPTAMMFVRSRGGVSHSRAEDSSETDLTAALQGFASVIKDLIAGAAISG